MAIACPKCHFAGSEILPDGSRSCANCGYVFQAQLQFPPPPSSVGSPVPVASSRSVVLVPVVIALVLVVLAGGFVAFFSASKPDTPLPKIPPPRTSASAKSDHAPIPQKPAQAKIDQIFSGNANGTSWWVAKYVNTGDVAIAYPTVVMNYTDTAGHKQSAKASAMVTWLPPGEPAWILASRKDVGNGRVTFSVDGPRTAAKTQHVYRRLHLVSAERDKNYIVGRIKNDDRRTLTSIYVFVIGYDTDDQPCSFSMGFPEVTTLAPGVDSDFKLMKDVFVSRPATHWKVATWGRVKD